MVLSHTTVPRATAPRCPGRWCGLYSGVLHNPSACTAGPCALLAAGSPGPPSTSEGKSEAVPLGTQLDETSKVSLLSQL